MTENLIKKIMRIVLNSQTGYTFNAPFMSLELDESFYETRSNQPDFDFKYLGFDELNRLCFLAYPIGYKFLVFSIDIEGSQRSPLSLDRAIVSGLINPEPFVSAGDCFINTLN